MQDKMHCISASMPDASGSLACSKLPNSSASSAATQKPFNSTRNAKSLLVGYAVVVLGSCSDPGQLAAPLRAPGYLDHAVALPAPGAQERASMLASHLSARGAHCDAASLQVGEAYLMTHLASACC